MDWLGGSINYKMGVDGISMLFVVLTAFLMPLCILASWESIDERVKEYMIAFLVLETLMIGVFCALDLVLFYLFFEGGLIPMFLIIGVWGGKRRVYASFKFFLYTLLGSVLMLLAMMAMYWHAGTTDIPTLLTHKFPSDMQWWLWLAFFASFAVKMPMWPVHTWLPDAHVEAPTAGSVILAGILLKMGGYGFLRFSLPMFPLASQEFAPLVFALSVVAIIYTSLVALAQEDVKKLIAYSSVAHMGFVTMGIFTFTVQGVDGAIFQMLSHGIVSAALFLCVGVVYDRMHTREIAAYGGLVNRMPIYAVCFMVFTMANVGLPGTSGFVGEFLTLLGAFKANTWVAFFATFGVILSAAYALWLYRRMIFGPLEKPSLQEHPRPQLPRGAGAGAAGDPDHPVRLLSGAAARRDGGVGQQARLQLPGGAEGGLRPERALEAAERWTRARSRAYWLLAPEIVLVVGAMALLMLGVFRPETDREAEAIGWLAVIVLALAAWLAIQQPPSKATLFDGAFVVDGFARFMKVLTLVSSAAALILSFDYMREAKILKFEYPVLVLLATAGMLMMISANDLISLYLGLELQSLALYVVAALRRDDVRSSEAGLKYFVLGALSSGMLLYGASLIYGFTGSTSFAKIAAAAAVAGAGQDIGLIIGLVFLLVGLAFKISAVPFHMWTPDVYEGAPTPVTTFFAAAPKVAAVALLMRVTFERLSRHRAAVAAGGDGAGHRLDGPRRLRRHRPDQHQAAAGLLGDRQHRLHADRPGGGDARGRARRGDLPRHLRGHDARRVRLRAVHAPAGRHGRGDRRAVGPRPEQPRHGDRAGDRAVLDGRHPAAGRLLRQVLRVRRRREGGAVAARGVRRAGQRGRRLLLRAHRQGHVLRRAEGALPGCAAQGRSDHGGVGPVRASLRGVAGAVGQRGRRGGEKPVLNLSEPIGCSIGSHRC